MIRYKPYPAYKDSGTEWLGEVPEGWEVKRLRHVASFKNSNVDKKTYEDQIPVKLCNYTDVYYNELITKNLSFMPSTASANEIEQFSLKKGDVIITKDSGNKLEIGVPALVSEEIDGIVCGYHMTIIRCDNFDTARLLHRILQSRPTKAHFLVKALGVTIYGLSQDAIADTSFCLPPGTERRKIVDHIDHETSFIDALIQKNTRLMELLKEKRSALITHAVTKGLDPNVKMKESGMPWLGEIPSHWTVQTVWMNFILGRGRVISHSDISSQPGPYPVYSSQTENDGILGSISTYDFSGEYLTWTTDGAKAGTVFRRQGKFNCTNVCGTLKPKQDLDLTFFHHAIDCSVQSFVRLDINPKLMNNVIANIRIAVPPLVEQGEIANFIISEIKKIEHLHKQTETMTDCLRERRSAFITAAVTGQIDLREAA